jgi:hypothetical protein
MFDFEFGCCWVVMNGLGWKRRQYRYGFGFGERERKLMEGGECPDVCA